ncbi:hypothetical protein DTO021D3_5164 [Paecilomyces variotii]|nr:hypothetical protein DTO032I3_5483 [Paecilomyces variotii]KAJ9278032.1 hypothetical protein DTO021D3_5164 [Paecilomyces variotii]KAJ9341849.1 hypothetical protein DTO027B6_5631 [Paecilomyces variotii]KAJ9389419.1 hypothetical protein DTO032I4_2444 [Paecilomyces variotii]
MYPYPQNIISYPQMQFLSKSALLTLPIEIIEDIAFLLEDDKDLINLSLTCTSLNAILLSTTSSIWRRRFKEKYDLPRGKSSAQIKFEYQTRSIVLSQAVSFKDGESGQQKLWLEVIQLLLEESFSSPYTSDGSVVSRNLTRIREVIPKSSFLERPISGFAVRRPDVCSDAFCAVQLCLTYLSLDLNLSYRCLRTDYDIASVYSYGSAPENVFISIEELDLRKLLHIRNFWQRHLVNPDEGTFHKSFASLCEEKRPQPWTECIHHNITLGSSWLGYYSCIHPRPPDLNSLQDRQTCADLDTHWTDILPLHLHLHLIHDSDEEWPALFDNIIPLLGPDSRRRYFRGLQCLHSLNDRTSYPVRGLIEQILSSQGGLRGWTRICFTIYNPNRELLKLIPSEDNEENAEDQQEEVRFPDEEWPPISWSDFHWAFGYEGVVLPGGNIMFGKWINMLETSDSGPFVFWCI